MKLETVRVSDTADGLIISEADFNRLGLVGDYPYRGRFLSDGSYQIEVPDTYPVVRKPSLFQRIFRAALEEE